MASYHAPDGHYADDENYFASPVDNAPLHAPASGTLGNGVYRVRHLWLPESDLSGHQLLGGRAVHGPDPARHHPTPVSAASPLAGATSVPTTAVLTTTFNEAINPATLSFTLTGSGGAVATTTSYDPTSFTITITPSAPLDRRPSTRPPW